MAPPRRAPAGATRLLAAAVLLVVDVAEAALEDASEARELAAEVMAELAELSSDDALEESELPSELRLAATLPVAVESSDAAALAEEAPSPKMDVASEARLVATEAPAERAELITDAAVFVVESAATRAPRPITRKSSGRILRLYELDELGLESWYEVLTGCKVPCICKMVGQSRRLFRRR